MRKFSARARLHAESQAARDGRPDGSDALRRSGNPSAAKDRVPVCPVQGRFGVFLGGNQAG